MPSQGSLLGDRRFDTQGREGRGKQSGESAGLGEWIDAAASQRMPEATRSWKKRDTDSPQQRPEGTWLC